MIQAQESMNSSGDDYESSDGSVAVSVGQVFVDYIEDSDGITVSEGVQQTYVFIIEEDVDSNLKQDFTFEIYPNPSSDLVTLKFNTEKLPNAEMVLFDNLGKKIIESKIVQEETDIDISYLANAIYYLHIFDKNMKIGTIKILKQ